MEKVEVTKPDIRRKYIPFIVQIILIYILFVISIIISISYTEWIAFHRLTFNPYIWNKVFRESLNNTSSAFLVSVIITYILHYFRKPKFIANIENAVNNLTNNFVSGNNIVVATATLLIFAFTSLPLYTSISSYYVGNDGTFFELNFVHLTSSIKIITSLTIIGITFLILKYKYKYIFKDLLIVLCVLALLSSRGILLTQNKNFATAEAELISIYNSNQQFEVNGSIDKATLDKVDPLAHNLVKMSSTNSEFSDAYYWLARIKSNEGDLDQALMYINISASYKKNLQKEYLIRSDISYHNGNFEQSKQEALKCQDLIECVLRTGYFYALDNNFVIARKYFKKAVDMYPEQIYVRKYYEYYLTTKLPVERINYITLLGGTKPAEIEYDQCLSPVLASYKKQFDTLCIQAGKPSNCTAINSWEAEAANATVNKEWVACHVTYIKNLD